MKIAFISDAVYIGNKGGLEYTEMLEARELAKDKRNEVHFYSMRWPGMEKDFVHERIHYHTLTKTDISKFYRHGRRSIRTSIMFTLSMIKIFPQKFDVIEANMFPILHIPILKAYCKLRGCKLILDVVEVWERKYWSDYLKNRFFGELAYKYAAYFLGSAQAYIANSSVTIDRLKREGINDERIYFFNPNLEMEELDKARKAARRKPRIFFSGRFIKEKRLDLWLRVVKEVHAKLPKTEALLIGDGPEADALRKQIKAQHLEKVVAMRPFYPEESEMWEQLASSSVLLMVSEREGLSAITLKSLALGVPAVLPEKSPIPDEVKSMCVVEKEPRLASKVVEIIKSGKPEKYIKNRDGLKRFSSANVIPFYDGLFTNLFKRGKQPNPDE